MCLSFVLQKSIYGKPYALANSLTRHIRKAHPTDHTPAPVTVPCIVSPIPDTSYKLTRHTPYESQEPITSSAITGTSYTPTYPTVPQQHTSSALPGTSHTSTEPTVPQKLVTSAHSCNQSGKSLSRATNLWRHVKNLTCSHQQLNIFWFFPDRYSKWSSCLSWYKMARWISSSHIFYLFHLKDYTIGCQTEVGILPSIRNNQNIFVLQSNNAGNKPYDDNKCVFGVWLCIEA